MMRANLCKVATMLLTTSSPTASRVAITGVAHGPSTALLTRSTILSMASNPTTRLLPLTLVVLLLVLHRLPGVRELPEVRRLERHHRLAPHQRQQYRNRIRRSPRPPPKLDQRPLFQSQVRPSSPKLTLQGKQLPKHSSPQPSPNSPH